MNKILIAATIAVAANWTYLSDASAQATAATTSDDEWNKLLGGSDSSPAATAPEANTAADTGAAAAPIVPAAPEAAGIGAEPAAVTANKPEPYTDVIPVPQSPAPKIASKAEPKRANGIEEVIVTAQRREESLQDVPISITVIDAKQIANANITNPSDLAAFTPSMSTNQRFGADNATFSIRGFTQELRTTPSVATYMAEVVAPRGQSSQTSGDGAGPGALFDLANVQVLKGPQGTLFGRNTTGGAVLLTPNKPKDEFEGYIEVSGTELAGKRAQFAASIPAFEHLKFRIAVDRNQRDGHLTNVTGIGADKLGSSDFTATRLSSVWDITDNIQNYTMASYVDSKSTGYSSQLYACNANYSQGLAGGLTPANLLATVQGLASGAINPPPGFFLAFSGALQVAQCQSQLSRQAAAGQNGFYDLISTIKTPITAIKEKRLINTLTWDINEDIKLKNILAYAHLNTKNGSDIFGTQFQYALLGVTLDPDANREFKTGVSVLNPNEPVTSQATYVAELQLQGSSFEKALDWQGGLYYESSRPDGFSGNNSAGLISCNMASLEGPPSGFDCYDPLGGVVGGVLVTQYKTTYLNRAAYSQSTWHINDEFSLTGGLRYTWDHTEGYGVKTRYAWLLGVAQSPTTAITQPVVSSKAPTGVLEFDYKPFEGSLAYAKYLRGYRQGNVILAADPGVDTFKPENVNTYELGLKTEFGGPVPGRFNMAVFTNNLSNQQLQLGYISPGSLQTTTIANAGKSRIRGLEGDAYFQVIESVSLALSFSMLDTKLLSQTDQTARVGAAGGPIAQASVTPIANVGDELPYAPKLSYTAALNWRLPLPESVGDVEVGTTYSFIGRQRSAASNSGPYGLLDSFSLLNLNLTWTRIFNSALDFALFGTNVLNSQYTTYTSGTYNLLGYESRAIGTPRIIGGRLKVNFGAYQQ